MVSGDRGHVGASRKRCSENVGCMSFDQKQQMRLGLASGRTAVHPELELITRYPSWCQFGTLTFENAGGVAPSQGFRYKLAFAWLRAVAGMAGLDFSRLLWVLRDELGENTLRAHFHVLLGRTHLPLNPSTNFRLMAAWERLGGGMARVKTFNRSLAGAEYVSKCLSGESTRGESSYELDKFGWTDRPPILSHSLVEYLARRTLCGAAPVTTPRGSSGVGESSGRPITRDVLTGNRDRRAGQPARLGLHELSSLLWRFGRHPYGPGRKGVQT